MSLKANGLKNSISLDQFMAHTHRLGSETRFSTLALLPMVAQACLPGKYAVFFKHRSTHPLLQSSSDRFERLFGLSGESIDAQRKGLSQMGATLIFYLTMQNPCTAS